MKAHMITRGAVVALLLLATSGCGEPEPPAGETFVGRTYVSTSATDSGQPKELVAGTQLTLTFNADSVGASAGCNSMSASGGIEDGVLQLQGLGGTEMACDEPLMAQEQWWGEFLMAQPTAEVGDRALTLRTATAEVSMVAQESIPDLPLYGTSWQLDTIITGDTAASSVAGVAAGLALGAGVLSIDVADCRATQVPVTVTATGWTFDPAAFATSSCTGDAAAVDAAVVAVFSGGDVGYQIEGDLLTVSGAEGASLVYRGA